MDMNEAKKPLGKDPVACPQCDLLMVSPRLAGSQRALCSRCGGLIRRAGTDSIDRALALSAAALILFLPANFLPILSLNMLGKVSDVTMVGAVKVMFSGGLPLVGLMVIFCSILAPLATTGLLFVVLASLRAGRCPGFLPGWFRFYQHLDSWAMLEVYMIALLVSIIKLLDMARVEVGLGLFCFIGLMITHLASKAVLDRAAVWEGIETACTR